MRGAERVERLAAACEAMRTCTMRVLARKPKPNGCLAAAQSARLASGRAAPERHARRAQHAGRPRGHQRDAAAALLLGRGAPRTRALVAVRQGDLLPQRAPAVRAVVTLTLPAAPSRAAPARRRVPGTKVPVPHGARIPCIAQSARRRLRRLSRSMRVVVVASSPPVTHAPAASLPWPRAGLVEAECCCGPRGCTGLCRVRRRADTRHLFSEENQV